VHARDRPVKARRVQRGRHRERVRRASSDRAWLAVVAGDAFRSPRAGAQRACGAASRGPRSPAVLECGSCERTRTEGIRRGPTNGDADAPATPQESSTESQRRVQESRAGEAGGPPVRQVLGRSAESPDDKARADHAPRPPSPDRRARRGSETSAGPVDASDGARRTGGARRPKFAAGRPPEGTHSREEDATQQSRPSASSRGSTKPAAPGASGRFSRAPHAEHSRLRRGPVRISVGEVPLRASARPLCPAHRAARDLREEGQQNGGRSRSWTHPTSPLRHSGAHGGKQTSRRVRGGWARRHRAAWAAWAETSWSRLGS
jgi:hypothetical protein